MAVSMSAMEVNVLIYHYFLETGLHTSAFALKAEAGLPHLPVIPPGSLIAYLEKALIFTRIETHLFDSAQHPHEKCINDTSLLGKHDCQYRETQPKSPRNDVSETNFNALSGHTGEINEVHWSPYGQVILTSYRISRAQDGSARLWKAESRLQESKAIALLPHITKSGQSGKSVRAIPWNVRLTQPRGIALTFAEDGVARMWDLRGNLLQVLLEQTGIRLAKWNRSGNALLTVGTEESPVVWSESGQVLKQYHAVSASIACIDWANDTEFLIGTVTGDISIYSLNQPFPTVISANELESVRMLVCRESGDLVAAADEKNVCVWTLAGDIVLHQVMNVSSIAWNPKFTVLTIGCATGRVYSWDASSKNTVDTEGGHQGSVTTLAYRSEGDLFASAAADQHLKVWRLRDGKLLLDLERTAAIKDMCVPFRAWNAEGTRLAFAEGNRLIVQDFQTRL